MNNREYYQGRSFRDPINYPYGIEKSGDYSIRESMLLGTHGALCMALMNGEVENPSKEDRRLIKVVYGKLPARTDVERIWLKYWNKTHSDIRIPSMIMASGHSVYESHVESIGEWI